MLNTHAHRSNTIRILRQMPERDAQFSWSSLFTFIFQYKMESMNARKYLSVDETHTFCSGIYENIFVDVRLTVQQLLDAWIWNQKKS